MKNFLIVLSIGLYVAVLAVPAHSMGEFRQITNPVFENQSKESLHRLMKGNKDYLRSRLRWFPKFRADKVRAQNATEGQKPYAAVLGCSDSRSPVEEIFNATVGDIFVVRTAGNTAGHDQQASMEFAVDALNVPLIMVLGHTQCGAVVAAVTHAEESGKLGEFLSSLAALVRQTDKIPPDDRIETGTNLNVEIAVKDLRNNPRIAKAIKEGRVKVVGALHNIRTGEVSLINVD